jgi:hypothetical protein
MNDQDFDKLSNGVKVLLYANDDSNTNMITLKSYPNPDFINNDDDDDDNDNDNDNDKNIFDENYNSKFLYEVYYVYDKNVFNNINDAYNRLFKICESVAKPSEKVKFRKNYINNQNIFFNSLITKKKFLTKELIQHSRESNIVFCQSKYYNNYMDSFDIFDDSNDHDIHIYNNNNDFLLKYKTPKNIDLIHQDDIYIFTREVFKELKDKYRFIII